MKKKRNLFSEIMEGLNEIRRHREGKITLRTYVLEDPPPCGYEETMKVMVRINRKYFNAFYELRKDGGN